MFMFSRDKFNTYLDDIVNKKYIIFGERHEHQSRMEIYKCIDTIIDRGYTVATAIAVEELLDKVAIKDNYEYYLREFQLGLKNRKHYIGCSDSSIRYCMEQNLHLYGIEKTTRNSDSKFRMAELKDEYLSSYYGKKIYSNIFKYKEEWFYKNIVKIKGYDKLICIVGDSHLRTRGTIELGSSSYLVKNFRNSKDVCFIREVKKERR